MVDGYTYRVITPVVKLEWSPIDALIWDAAKAPEVYAARLSAERAAEKERERKRADAIFLEAMRNVAKDVLLRASKVMEPK